MTTFDPLNFDAIGPLRHIRHLDADKHTDLGFYASDLARAYAELAAQYEAQLKTLAILRGHTRPPSCNRTGVEAEFTLDGFDAEATPFDPAEVHQLNQILADDLDAKDVEIGFLTRAFVDVAKAVARSHYADLAAGGDRAICVSPCGACDITQLIPADILDAAGITAPATASQGDQS